jgi:UDP-4-amino-4,6-dideoxy-N-acetyl-beta-L-altrosamine transaminase
MIPYGRQQVTDADVEAVVATLRSDFLTQGPAVPRFEAAIASRTRAAHAIATNSATSALHIACLALGLGPGDSLWTVPISFVASANCARYCGADVHFVDIDANTWNIDVPALELALQRAAASGQLPKVLVPVHLAGQPTEQEAIWELAKKYGFKVLEDASHSIGASRHGEPVGSCRWSDITVFSFHPVKIITSAEGGMALTNDAELALAMQLLRSHGITREPEAFVNSSPGGWYYEQQLLGFNYRMTDVQAALGTSQLLRLDEYIERRNELARRYDRELAGLPLQLPTVQPANLSAFHLYVVRLPVRDAGRHRQVFTGLRERGIGVNVHYVPIHLQPYYRARGFHQGQFPEAEAYGESAITIPLYPLLSESEQDLVVRALREVV